jgi:hypothetical protein
MPLEKFFIKYRFYILTFVLILTVGYFMWVRRGEEELVDNFICPTEDIDIEYTLAYFEETNDIEKTFKILDYLKERGCDIALLKLQARMIEDIESGNSPGSL